MALKPPPLTSKLDDFAWKEWFQSIYRELTTTGAVASFAPKGATYVTLSNEATLSSERVLTAGANITLTDNGANNTIVVASTATGGLTTVYDDPAYWMDV